MLSQSLADEALRFLGKRTLVQTDIRILRSLLHSNTIDTAISIRLLEDLCESSKVNCDNRFSAISRTSTCVYFVKRNQIW